VTSTELERLPTRSGPIAENEWATLARITNTIAATEFVPKGLRGNKPAVMACILYGRDQGLSPMVSLSEISMVEGKPTMSAALMAAKIREAGHKLWREEILDGGDVVGITALGQRTDGTEDKVTFTLGMAKRAGLAGKTNWQKYPEAMLWARACSALARTLFSDVFLGSVYTPEEIGVAETDEEGKPLEGEVVESTPEPEFIEPEAVDDVDPGEEVTHKQHGRLAKLIEENDARSPREGGWEKWSQDYALTEFGKPSRAKLTKREMSALMDALENEALPF
jgi:hypothetical protein